MRGRNYPRWFLLARRKAVVVRKITRCDSVEMRERRREKERGGSWSIAIAWSRPERSPPMVGDDRLLASRIEGRRAMNLWTFGPSWRGSTLNYEIFIRPTCVRLSKIYPLCNGIADKISCRSFISFLSFSLFFFTYTIQMCTKEVNVLKFHNIYINLKKLDYKLIISNRWSFKR